MTKVRVAIAGVGNCAASLVQGVAYYAKNPEDTAGLMHPTVGTMTAADIEFVAAFDVAESKVGLDLGEAIFAAPNNGMRFDVELPYYDVTVVSGDALDGIGDKYAQKIDVVSTAVYEQHAGSAGKAEDTQTHAERLARVTEHLRATKTEVLVSYMPVGSTEATHFYAQAAIDAGCAFVNAVPVPMARDEVWVRKFEEAGLPLVGDDIKSQFGATILHRMLVQLMHDRGYHLDRTYQLNVGGNMDFFNMLQQDRLRDKKISKGQAVTSVVGHHMDPDDVHIGPSDFVPWLGDHKIAFIRCEGRGFGGVPFDLEVRLDVVDSPNSAGIVIDAVRAAKLALSRGHAGVLGAPSAWLMKAPAVQMRDEDAMVAFEEFATPDLTKDNE